MARFGSAVEAKMSLGQLNWDFSSFFAKYLAYLMTFQRCSAFIEFHNQICQTFGKNEEKPCSTFLKTFFSMTLPRPVPDPSLIARTTSS